MSLVASSRARLTWIVVLLFPIFLNGAELLGILKADPVYSFSYLQSKVVRGPLDLHPVFDPSIGVVFQPLGKRSADELIHGQIPWWNSLQGIGAPLAGEMTPGSFYPLIFLELLPNGQVVLDVAVEMLAGACMLLLARRLGLGLFAGATAALLFEMNGTFAWLNAGWTYPLPFLPLLIYGVELGVGPDLRERIGGTILVAIAVAASISASMIEVAYLDGLLGLAWAILRIAQTRLPVLPERLLRLSLGGVVGVLLASPLLIAFGDFLSISYVGMHTGGGGPGGLDLRGLTELMVPYILGPVFYHDSGYGGVALWLVAVCGLFGKHLRSVRLLLGGWVFVAVGATVGLPIVSQAFYAIPGVQYTAYGRYVDGSWEFALALLAAFFVYDLAQRTRSLWVRCAAATSVFLVTVAYGTFGALAIFAVSFSRADYAIWGWISIAWSVLVIGLLWLLTIPNVSATRRSVAVVSVILLEACFNYSLPTLGYPVQAPLVEGSANFLRDHLGLQRAFTLGPIAPNYASYFGIAELDDAELPVAKTWADFMMSHLDSLTDQGWVNGQNPGEVAKNINWYEDAGMKYLLTTTGNSPYENFSEPVDSDVAGQAINLLDNRGPIHVRLGSIPSGSLAALAVDQGNYGNSADGDIVLHVCTNTRCVDGRRPFSESPNNQGFWVTLDRPLDVTDGQIRIDIAQAGAKMSDAVWLYERKATSDERVTIDGKAMNDRVVQLALAYNSVRDDLSGRAAKRPVTLTERGISAIRTTVPLSAGVAQYLDAVDVTGTAASRAESGRRMQAHVCSIDRCLDATRSADGAGTRMARFVLPQELKVERDVLISLHDAVRSRGTFGVALEISTERPSLVYRDEVVDVFEMPHPADYFSAPNCVLVPQARERLTADCVTPSRLTRRELYLPGWSATLNGRPVAVEPVSTIYQSVALPAGESSLAFSFVPPLMEYGYAAFTLALLILGYQAVAYVRLGRRRSGDVSISNLVGVGDGHVDERVPIALDPGDHALDPRT